MIGEWSCGDDRLASGRIIHRESWRRAPDGSLSGNLRITFSGQVRSEHVLSISGRGGALRLNDPSEDGSPRFYRLVRLGAREAVFVAEGAGPISRITYRRTEAGLEVGHRTRALAGDQWRVLGRPPQDGSTLDRSCAR